MLRTLEIVTLRDGVGYAVVGLAVAIAGIAAHRHPIAITPAPEISIAADQDVTEVAEIAAAHENAPPLPPPPPSSDVMFVFTGDGATYMALENLESDKLPRHANVRLTRDEDVDQVVARVDVANVSPNQRAWLHREVIVDSTCRAHVTGFAIVGRVTGDPSYTEESTERSANTWTSAGILKYGHAVLAAKLDHCAGTYARDATSEAAVAFEAVEDNAYVAAATAKLLASPLAADAASEWAKNEQTGKWFEADKLATLSVRDPRSGVTWISVHGHPGYTCGGPNINIWGLFRVERDGSLTTVQLRTLGDLVSIDKLVDIDGDGIPELLGETWLGPTMLLTTATGEERGRLEVPFIGCPC